MIRHATSAHQRMSYWLNPALSLIMQPFHRHDYGVSASTPQKRFASLFKTSSFSFPQFDDTSATSHPSAGTTTCSPSHYLLHRLASSSSSSSLSSSISKLIRTQGSQLHIHSHCLPPTTVRRRQQQQRAHLYQQRRWQSTGGGANDADIGAHARPSANDLYARLGVPRDATQDDIKKAYRILAMKYHPDTAGASAETQENFRRVKEAHEVLTNSGRRVLYDRTGTTSEDMHHLRKGSIKWTTGFRGRRVQNADGSVTFYLPLFWLATAVLSIMAFFLFASQAAGAGDTRKFIWNFSVILFIVSFVTKFPAALILYFLYGRSASNSSHEPEWAGDNVSALVSVVTPEPPQPSRLMVGRPHQPRVVTVELVGVPATVAFSSYAKLTMLRGDDPSKAAIIKGQRGYAHVIIPETMLSGPSFHGTISLVSEDDSRVWVERTWNPVGRQWRV